MSTDYKLNICSNYMKNFKYFNNSNYQHLNSNDVCIKCLDNYLKILKCVSNSTNLRISRWCRNLLSNQEKEFNEVESKKIKLFLILLLIFVSVLIFLGVLVFSIYYRRRWRKSYDEEISSNGWRIKTELKNALAIKNHKELEDGKKEIDENSITTGVGPCELVERTLSRDLHIEYERGPLGRGRFGVVWLAQLHSSRVAVKSLLSVHEPQWSRECRVYSTPMFAHPNLLGFIGADILGLGCQVNMLIVTEYHPLGSLYDYLTCYTLDRDQMLKILSSTSSGLAHLHGEIRGVTYKPQIAHRDLKTKNILVKRDMECCLADFGSSMLDEDKEVINDERVVVGSARYMAPEILYSATAETSRPWYVGDYKCADIYSFALVMWEVLSRLKSSPHQSIDDHKPPYFDLVRGDPSLHVMKEIVCDQKIRPSLQRLDSFEEVKEVIEMMKECWNEKPSERLSALNLKKKFLKLTPSLFIEY